MRENIKKNLVSIAIGCALGLPIAIYGFNHREPVVVVAEVKENSTTEAVEEPKPKAILLTKQVASELEISKPEPEEPKYFDVPLSHELQDFIFSECDKASISPALVIAMIERESCFKADVIGDNGKAFGLMQIHPRWHQERMDRLGCTDLLNPYDNIKVGMDILSELFHTNSEVYWVLMAYNGGIDYANKYATVGNYSEYALEISERVFELEGGGVLEHFR